MSEMQNNPFRVILLAATIWALFASSSLSADMKTLRKQAEAGDANAQFDIGSMYENGSGLRQDYAAAAKWYREAADGEGMGEISPEERRPVMTQPNDVAPERPSDAPPEGRFLQAGLPAGYFDFKPGPETGLRPD